MTRKLLLADDSVTIQKVVELVLSGEGFEIRSANNGEEALAVMPEFRPDIVLSDIEMPVMDGYKLCKIIKTDPDTRDIPVILLAGVFEPINEELARDSGADERIIKPFESQELIGKINAVLAIKEAREAVAVEADIGEAAEAAVPADEYISDDEIMAFGDIPLEPAAEGYGFGETLLEDIEEAAALESETLVAEEIPEEKHEERAKESILLQALPAPEVLAEIFRKSVDEKISGFIDSIDIRGSVLSAITPAVRESVEKVMWEIAPGLIDRLLKEMLEGALASLTKEVEKVVWETVPDIAERMILREIESIRSEISG